MLVLVVVVVVSMLQVTSAQSQGLSVNISGADAYQVITYLSPPFHPPFTHLSSTSPTSPHPPHLTRPHPFLIHLTHFTSSYHISFNHTHIPHHLLCLLPSHALHHTTHGGRREERRGNKYITLLYLYHSGVLEQSTPLLLRPSLCASEWTSLHVPHP